MKGWVGLSYPDLKKIFRLLTANLQFKEDRCYAMMMKNIITMHRKINLHFRDRLSSFHGFYFINNNNSFLYPGSRFALCELKIFLYHILLHIEVSPSARTQLPSILSPECFNPRLVGGHWLTFRARA